MSQECQCSLRTKLVGDGCEVCNPELAQQIHEENEAEAMSQEDKTELCGAWAGNGYCTMLKGHNMGNLDIPSNHKSERTDARWMKVGAQQEAEIGELQAKITEQAELLAQCAQYLKEGETPAQRIQREIDDNAAVLGLLAKEKKLSESHQNSIARLQQDVDLRATERDAFELERDNLREQLGQRSAHITALESEAERCNDQLERIYAKGSFNYGKIIGRLEQADRIKALEAEVERFGATVLKIREALTGDIHSTSNLLEDIVALQATIERQRKVIEDAKTALKDAKGTLVAFKFVPTPSNTWEPHDDECVALIDATIADLEKGVG